MVTYELPILEIFQNMLSRTRFVELDFETSFS